MRGESHDGLVDGEVVFVALKPSPLVSAGERDVLVDDRRCDVVVGEVGVHGAPGREESGDDEGGKEGGDREPFGDREKFGRGVGQDYS